MAEAPHRAYHLFLDLDADSMSDLVDALADIQYAITIEDRTGSTCGGSTRGWHWKLDIDPEMTHVRFIEVNAAYVKELHAPKPKVRIPHEFSVYADEPCSADDGGNVDHSHCAVTNPTANDANALTATRPLRPGHLSDQEVRE